MWLHHNLHAYNITMGLLDKVIAIGSLLLLSFWTWLPPRRGMILSLAVLNLSLTALIYADMVYYRYFQDFLTIPVLLQARQVDALGDSIATLIYTSDLWFFADWLVVIPFALSYCSADVTVRSTPVRLLLVTGVIRITMARHGCAAVSRLAASPLCWDSASRLARFISTAKHGPKACSITTGGMYPCTM